MEGELGPVSAAAALAASLLPPAAAADGPAGAAESSAELTLKLKHTRVLSTHETPNSGNPNAGEGNRF